MEYYSKEEVSVWRFTKYCRVGDVENVKEMLKNPDLYLGFTFVYGNPLSIACEYNQIEVVKLLLQDQRIKPHWHSNAPIQIASQHGNLEIVRLLLQHPRVDPSDDKNLAIKIAHDRNHLQIVLLLLQDSRVKPFRFMCDIIDEILEHRQDLLAFNIINVIKGKLNNDNCWLNGTIFHNKQITNVKKLIRKKKTNKFMRDYSKLIKQLNKLFKQHNLCNNVIKYIWKLVE